jgi:hypothetical protein
MFALASIFITFSYIIAPAHFSLVDIVIASLLKEKGRVQKHAEDSAPLVIPIHIGY